MPVIYIPPQLKPLTDGTESVELEGTTVRALINELDNMFPGVRDRLCQDDDLRPGINVSVSGRVTSLGLYQKVQPGDEIHFIPAISGG